MNGASHDLARAVCLAICLDLAAELALEDAEAWRRGVEALRGHPRIAENLYDEQPGTPAQATLQAEATAAWFGPPDSW